MALSVISIDNRLGTILPTAAQQQAVPTTSAGPVAGDLGYDASAMTSAECMRVFDLTLTVGTSGDKYTLAIPDTLQYHAASPSNAGLGHTGLGLDISVLPLNAAAVGASPSVGQDATTIAFTFTGASVAPSGGGSGAAAEFFAQMPGDNAQTVGANVPVSFPQAGPTAGVAPVTAAETGNPTGTRFTVVTTGVYQIAYQVCTTEPGQLALHVNGTIQPATTAARMGVTAGGWQISNTVLLALTAGQVVDLRNPAGNTPALTITVADGSRTHAVGATIVFQLLGAGAGGAATAAKYRVKVNALHSIMR